MNSYTTELSCLIGNNNRTFAIAHVTNSDWPPLSTKSSLINEAKDMNVLEIEENYKVSNSRYVKEQLASI